MYSNDLRFSPRKRMLFYRAYSGLRLLFTSFKYEANDCLTVLNLEVIFKFVH